MSVHTRRMYTKDIQHCPFIVCDCPEGACKAVSFPFFVNGHDTGQCFLKCKGGLLVSELFVGLDKNTVMGPVPLLPIQNL